MKITMSRLSPDAANVSQIREVREQGVFSGRRTAPLNQHVPLWFG